MVKSYDLIIIGGGAAGFSALVKYNELTGGSRSIALINDGLIGGTCVNVGCVPSKRLYHLAKEIVIAKKLIGNSQFNDVHISDIMKDIRMLVAEMRSDKYERVINMFENVDRFNGRAYFISRNEVKVEGGETVLSGKKIIIATGSRPRIPKIRGIDEIDYLTSNTIWNLSEDIDSLLVVGSGPVGLELSQALSRLGVKVTIVEMLNRVIPKTEADLSNKLTSILLNEGVNIYLKSQVSKFEQLSNGYIRARIIGPYGEKDIDVEKVLIATGRSPNTESLNIEKAGVDIDKHGGILVNKYLRTKNPNIYAAGDVSSTYKPAFLETISAREGVIAAINIVKSDAEEVDNRYVPVVVFTDPELAFTGMKEEDVINNLGGCICRLVKFEDLAVSKIMNYGEGVAKLVADPATRVLKGFHVLARGASEFISHVSLMLRHKYKIEDVIESFTVFPTASEIIKLSAQAFIRDIRNMPCCVE